MRILVTGGAASGKSAYAERRVLELSGPHIYIATMPVRGKEDELKVARHRELRAGRGFSTIEAPSKSAFDAAISKIPFDAAVLLEDMGNLVANALFLPDGTINESTSVRKAVDSSLDALASSCAHLVVVGCEIGSGTPAPSEQLRTYTELLGSLACEYAGRCDEVAEVVAGIPIIIKEPGQ